MKSQPCARITRVAPRPTLRQRPAHHGVPHGRLWPETERAVEALLAEKRVRELCVTDGHAFGDRPDLETALDFGRVVFVGGLAERGHDAAQAVRPGGDDEVAFHVAGEAEGAPAGAGDQREGELGDEGGGEGGCEGKSEGQGELGACAEEAFHGEGGEGVDEGFRDLRGGGGWVVVVLGVGGGRVEGGGEVEEGESAGGEEPEGVDVVGALWCVSGAGRKEEVAEAHDGIGYSATRTMRVVGDVWEELAMQS